MAKQRVACFALTNHEAGPEGFLSCDALQRPLASADQAVSRSQSATLAVAHTS